MTTQTGRLKYAGSRAEVIAAGLKAVRLGDRVVLLVAHEGQIYALDNRCPHMGFPLERGSVRNGVITCHWHHARFELCSGGTFDPFADDVRTYPVQIDGDDVLVDPEPRRDERAHQLARLQDGLEQNLSLVMAKAVIALLEQDVPAGELLALAGRFGAGQRDAGWRDGLTILTAMGNLLPLLAPEDRPLALYHGMLHVAANVAGQPPHYPLEPLATPSGAVGAERLEAWLREFAEVRDRDGCERVLLTAIAAGLPPQALADMLLAAATDHYYLDGGHTIDFINKAFELLDATAWHDPTIILPSVLPGIVAGARMEEANAWRNPVDLVALLEPIFRDLLAGRIAADPHQQGQLDDDAFDALVDQLLGDDPAAAAQALVDALAAGTALAELSEALSYAAAVRIGRFHTSNEFGDWISVLHTFTAANATDRLLRRAPSLEAARAIFHVAMHLYLNRFLNAPPARPPSAAQLEALPGDAEALLQRLLELTDSLQRTEEAAAVSARYLALGHPDAALLRTLAKTLLREDGEFHSYQLLEAGIRLYQNLRKRRPQHAPTVLLAVTRYLAGHAPTDRATTQTYRIAARLHAGEALADS